MCSWCARCRCGCHPRSPGSTSVRPSCARNWVPILDMSCDVAEARVGAMTGTMQVRVKRISYEAENINSYELVAATGGDLAAFAAGSHIDLHLQNGMIRSYSLVNDQRELSRYVIAVNKDAVGRGGSRFIHETVRAGDIIQVSRPRNNFALQEDAGPSILIAGGIGITP